MTIQFFSFEKSSCRPLLKQAEKGGWEYSCPNLPEKVILSNIHMPSPCVFVHT